MAESKSKQDMLTPREISTFCSQISMVLKSGISVSEGVLIMYEDMGISAGKEILEKIHASLEQGNQLHKALEDSGKFPKYVVDMAEIGETTGKLENVMDSLCVYYEREESISSTIKHAVTYPAIMMGMMLVVIIVLITQVLPIFNDVFLQLGTQMSGPSKAILDLGLLMSRYSFVLIGILALLIVFYLVLKNTHWGKNILKGWKANFFATKKINAKIASGRFASAMALMLSSGLDTDQSLDMVYRLVDNEGVRNKIDNCQKLITDGANFSEAVVKADIFTGIYARMITVGFKTGSVDTVMEKLASLYQDEIDAQIGSVISILEPTLVAILSIMVGLILLSVMFPLMGIMSTIG